MILKATLTKEELFLKKVNKIANEKSLTLCLNIMRLQIKLYSL